MSAATVQQSGLSEMFQVWLGVSQIHTRTQFFLQKPAKPEDFMAQINFISVEGSGRQLGGFE